MTFKVPESCRVRTGITGSDESYGNNGAFQVVYLGKQWNIMASEDEGWQHVSVSNPNEVPSWQVMNRIKDLFWGPEDCVAQYHPPHSDYVSFHPNCLHMWRPIGGGLQRPPSWLVGPVTGKGET